MNSILKRMLSSVLGESRGAPTLPSPPSCPPADDAREAMSSPPPRSGDPIITVRLPPETIERLDALGKGIGSRRSALIRVAIDEYVARNSPKSDPKEEEETSLPIVSPDGRSAASSRRCVEIGSIVSYYFVDSPDTIRIFEVTDSDTLDLDRGEVGLQSTFGRMIAGMYEGDEVGVPAAGRNRIVKLVQLAQAADTARRKGPLELKKIDQVQTPDFFLDDQPQIPPSSDDVSVPQTLAQYEPWVLRPLPNPRTASLGEVAAGLAEIVTAEHPVICERVFQIYCSAAGINRIGNEVCAQLQSALSLAVRSYGILSTNEYPSQDPLRYVLRPVGVPDRSARIANGRSIEDIPPSELAAGMRLISAGEPELEMSELYRRTLELFGFKRRTEKAKEMLSLAYYQMIRPPLNERVRWPVRAVE
jgi:hypothetical protein